MSSDRGRVSDDTPDRGRVSDDTRERERVPGATAERERIPAGQHVTKGWPVLHFGPVPRIARGEHRLRIGGAVERPLSLSLDELEALPQVEVTADFHCVTTWSRLDNAWGGVRLSELAARVGVRESARFVRFADVGDYDTTVPIECLAEALVAHSHDGAPLTAEHGGPLRSVVPSRYAWKSCKWLAEVEFLEEDRLGFWEVRGYHNGADPWREERLV